MTLHYFDNLPSGPVIARAAKLRMYLAKRLARGEILEGDRIVLVGHSTGGLDIRQLICDLGKPEHRQFRVDSGHLAISGKIRKCIDAVVFLSVPHWGTNIADWVRSHPVLRKAIVGDLRAAVTGSQVPSAKVLRFLSGDRRRFTPFDAAPRTSAPWRRQR